MKPLFQKTVTNTHSSMGVGGHMEFVHTETYWATFGGQEASAAEVAEWKAFAAKDPVEAKMMAAAAEKAAAEKVAAEKAAAEQDEAEKAAKLLQWRETVALKEGDSVMYGRFACKVVSADGELVKIQRYVGKGGVDYEYHEVKRATLLANP